MKQIVCCKYTLHRNKGVMLNYWPNDVLVLYKKPI